MTPTILRTDAELNMGESVMSEIRDIARVITAPDDAPGTIARLARDADLIFTCYAPITADVIEAATGLRGIVKYGVGVDSIDLEAATKRGVLVAHCPDYGTDTVADHAFALMISVARRLTRVDRNMREQGWLWPEPDYIGVDLAGKTLGLIGYGRIGKAMSRRATGFEMRQLVYDPYVPHDCADSESVQFAELDQVVSESDFLSLHCVLTPETRGIIGRSELKRMKDSAILVNVSRGALMDEDALADALEDGQIAGAGLDVFTKEPLAEDHPLARFDNVIRTPHFAFYTREAYERLENECLQAIRQLLAGEEPRSVRNAEALGLATSSSAPGARSDETKSEGDINQSRQRQAWHDRLQDQSTKDLLERDSHAFIHQSLSTPCLNTVARCDDGYLVDHRGRRIMDFHGNSAHQVGYGHPRVIEAIKKQLDELPFCPRRYTNLPAVLFAEKLAEISPGDLGKVLFTPSGTAAMGVAMKLARYVTGRHMTISMWDSFHGASLDAISIGGESLFRDGLGPLLPGCHHVPWPRSVADADAVEQLLREHREIGALIAEPMRCTTIECPPAAYWQRIRELCDEHGVLLVFDEIPLALGRTGKMLCCEHFDTVPDMLVLGKGLGGGVMPLAAVLVRQGLDVVPHRALGHYTHEKSPVGAAAGLATIEVIESENLVERSRDLGQSALQRLRDFAAATPLVSEVRGLGLALGVELRKDGEKAVDQAEQIMYTCLDRGLSFKVSDGNVLTLTPPLVISDVQLSEALTTVEEAIQEASDLA